MEKKYDSVLRPVQVLENGKKMTRYFHHAEYSLHLNYDDHQQLTFFAMNDADVFNR